MPFDQIELPALQRAACVRPDGINREARTIEIVWTTGATVQRVRWEGWDDRIEYDETLEVSERAVRLERMNAGAPFLNSHRGWGLESVLGTIVPGTVRIEDGKGFATIRLTEAPDVAPLVQRILEGTVRNVSVGYRVHRYDITQAEGEREHWRAVDWEPLEASAVAIPADPGAQVRSDENRMPTKPCVVVRRDAHAAMPAASAMRSDMPDENKTAADGKAGAVKTETVPEQTRTADPTPPVDPALTGKVEPAAPDADAVRAEERERINQIHSLARRHRLGDEFADDLVMRGVSLTDARTAILDKLADADSQGTRSTEPGVAIPRGGLDAEVTYRDALSEALMHRHDPAAHQLTDRARDFRGMSLVEMARDALERRGIRTRGLSKMEFVGMALGQRSGAGYHSTSDFPAILANVANKTLRAAYTSTPRTFTAWARRSIITDFKPVQRTQLGGAPDLQKVLQSGEFTYGTMGEGKEVYALATYGRIISITRQAIINDDLDAFTRIPAAFGAAAADLESDIVYSILIDNPAMGDGESLFSAAHENEGTASVINEASLAEAWRMFGQKTGIEERLISLLPRFILVPPGQRSVEARKQVTATTPNNTADVNTFAGRLEVVEEPRLIPAALPDPWFLAADPARIDTVEYAYLEGQEGVFTETRMGFEVDGIEIKARHDFASKAIDFRGLFKNAGANPA